MSPVDLTIDDATAVGSEHTTTGRGMLLGNPHFPWRGRYRFTQQHLTIPGRYDVAGASLIGSPVVNIGFNDRVAWSHTVSTAYRFTPYEYVTPVPGTTYLTAIGLLKQAEHRTVEVEVIREDGTLTTVEEDLYRVPQCYVIDAPALFMGWLPTSFWAMPPMGPTTPRESMVPVPAKWRPPVRSPSVRLSMIPRANIVPAEGPPTLSSWMVTSNGKSNVEASMMPSW